MPFPGTFQSPPGERNYFQYGLELSEQGFDAPALVAFERVAKSDPSAITFYNLGTLYMKLGRSPDAKTAFERALSLNPEYADVDNTLGALLAQSGDFPGAVAHFRKALEGEARLRRCAEQPRVRALSDRAAAGGLSSCISGRCSFSRTFPKR